KEERGLLKAPVAKQPTTNSQSTLRQRAVVNNESNLVQKKADQIQARRTPSSHDPTEDELRREKNVAVDKLSALTIMSDSMPRIKHWVASSKRLKLWRGARRT
ncbi:unnamed protein product, partial [Aphanomyces euteiches]